MAKNKLKLDPKNARQRTDRNRETIAKSLSEFGAARSIVIDKDGVVRAGNGTFEEAEKAGLKVRVIKGKPDELIAVQRDDWDESQATAYALVDNRSSELAEWDFDQLKESIGNLSERLQQAIGFDREDLEGVDVSSLWEGMPEYDQDDERSWTSLKIHFACNEDLQAFAQLIGQVLKEDTRFIWYPKVDPIKTVGQRRYE